MESRIRIKYNPGILGDEELIRSFVVRHRYLEILLEAVHENTGNSANRHLIVIGPRGIGKTMLVRRLAAEIRANPDYGKAWMPIVYGEESYQVSSSGEFWLEALVHFSEMSGTNQLDRTVDELRRERDDCRLRERALAQLLDLSDNCGKRILLIVENLNMLCDEMPEDDAWKLRHALLNEPRIMLIGTATSRFDAITDSAQAWFDLFAIHELKPLDHEETRQLWCSVTNQDLKPSHVRAIRILTGGTPRLLAVLAGFAAKRSFRELMEQLVQLIDDHTEYFKSHLDALAPKERKVFVTLLEQWNPVSAADVAQASRLSVNEVSTLLGRLASRGAVEIFEHRPRRKLYQAAERLYNIYYLMRRRGQPADRVRAAVSFMVLFYGSKQLATTIAALAKEACALPIGTTDDHFAAYAELAKMAPRGIRDKAVEKTPQEFFSRKDAPEYIRRLSNISALTALAGEIAKASKSQKWERVQLAIQRAIDVNGEQDWLLGLLGWVFGLRRQYADAVVALRRSIGVNPANWEVWRDLSLALYELKEQDEGKQADIEAARLLRGTIDSGGSAAGRWAELAAILERLQRPEEAITAYRKEIEVDPTHWIAWWYLGRLLVASAQLQEAELAYRKAVDHKPDACCVHHEYGRLLSRLGRHEEAQWYCEKAVAMQPKHASAWDDLAFVLNNRGLFTEAEEKYRKAIELDPESARVRAEFGFFLADRGRYDESAQVFQKALALDPTDRELWSAFGHLTSEHGSPAEAEKVWSQALELHPDLARCAVHLLDARSELGTDVVVLVAEAGEWIEKTGRDANVLASMARFIVRTEIVAALPKAETWAREAVSKDADWTLAETLSLVQAARGNWFDAIQASGLVLDAATESKEARERITMFLIQCAAAGFARESLDALSRSSSAGLLEPLAIGLRIHLGETLQVAKEILEIGKDVAEKIREIAQDGKGVVVASVH